MKRLMTPALAAVLVIGSALPVLAQPYGQPGRQPGYGQPVQGGGRGLQLRQRADQLEQRIRRGIADGSLDRREADRALGELAGVRRFEDDLLARGHGVLSPPERMQVSSRLDALERNIRWLRTNGRVAAPPPAPGAFRYGYGREFWNGAPQSLDQRLDWLEMRVRRGIENGSLTRGESDRAFALLRDFRRSRTEMAARHGGRLDRGDERVLSDRLNAISQQIRWLQTNDRRD